MNRFSRILALLTVWCLLWPLTACRPEEEPPSESLPVLDAYRAQYAHSPAFCSLPENQQTNYDALFTAVTERPDVDTILHSGEESGEEVLGLRVELPQELSDGGQVATLFSAFITDNPQFFYIGNSYTYEGYKVGDRAHYNVLCLTLTMNASERELASARMEEVLTTVTAGLEEKSPAERELILHDRLLARCHYAADAAASELPDTEYPFAFTAYGALVEGKAVCEGYARAFQWLCLREGIPCTTVGGIDLSNGMAHMWDLVTLEGETYHVDPTWDDQLDTALHVYFNLTTEEISRTHRLDSDSPGQNCTASEAGYYRATGRYQERYDREKIAAAVAKEVQNGAWTVELQFPPERLPSIGLFVKNHTWFSDSVNACLPEGIRLWDYEFHMFTTYGVLVLQKKNT